MKRLPVECRAGVCLGKVEEGLMVPSVIPFDASFAHSHLPHGLANHVSTAGQLAREARKLQREVERLVNALAIGDDKQEPIVRAIAERQDRLKKLKDELDAARRAPEEVDADLDHLRDMAREILERLRTTLESNPEQAREVLMARSMVFQPIKTKDGPRFRIEGDAHVGKFLGIEGAEPAAVLNGRPQRESNPR